MISSMGGSGSVEENKANMRRFVDEAFNRGILDVVDETRGKFAEQSKERILAYRAAFPDFHTTIELMVGEGDWLAVRLRHQGSHQGTFLGVPATGRRVDFCSMVLNRYEDGVVVENFGLHDHASALRQLQPDP
jgi:predicted ester cyclase